MSDALVLPAAFAARMQAQLGAEYADFLAALAQEPPISIRHNPLKNRPVLQPDGGFSTGLPEGEIIPWNLMGEYLKARPNFALDPRWHSGAYYAQEASSMLVALGLPITDQPLKVLDLCAAPGGKSTLLAAALPPGSLLVANEPITARNTVLRENLTRWGVPGVYISQNDPADFAQLAGFFDVVLVDAPCSGEGLWRKQASAVAEWSEAAIAHCALRQSRILAEAAPLVAPGGRLIYSTCTYGADENGRQINELVAAGDGNWQVLQIPFAENFGLVRDAVGGYQAYPHRVQGEGFYFCVLARAAGEVADTTPPRLRLGEVPAELAAYLDDSATWRSLATPDALWGVPKAHAEDFALLQKHLRLKAPGLQLGETQGKTLKPAHALALATCLAASTPSVELPIQAALRYLKGEALATSDLVGTTDLPASGWVVVRYVGLGLGWAKVASGRLNNHVPQGYRLRQQLPTEY